MTARKEGVEPYVRPDLVKHANIKETTFECPDWQCSVVVPRGPAP